MKKILYLLSLMVITLFLVVGCGQKVNDVGDENLPPELAGSGTVAGQATTIGSITYLKCEDSDGGNNAYVAGFTHQEYEYPAGIIKKYDQVDALVSNVIYERICTGDRATTQKLVKCAEAVSVPVYTPSGGKTAQACKCSTNEQCGEGYRCNEKGSCTVVSAPARECISESIKLDPVCAGNILSNITIDSCTRKISENVTTNCWTDVLPGTCGTGVVTHKTCVPKCTIGETFCRKDYNHLHKCIDSTLYSTGVSWDYIGTC